MTNRKPWYRPRNIVLSVLAIALLWIGWAVIVALTARPGDAIDYAAKLNELARASQPGGDIDAPNRWMEFNEILLDFNTLTNSCEWSQTRALGQTPDFVHVYDGGRFGSREDAAIARDEALACLAALRESDFFAQMEHILESGIVYREYDNAELPYFNEMPDLVAARALSRAIRAEFHTAVDQGRSDDAVSVLRLGIALASVQHNSVNIIGWLVGQAQCHLLLEAIRHEVMAQRLSPDQMRELLALLPEFVPRSAELAIEGERQSVLDIIQRVYTDNGSGNGRFLMSEFFSLDIDGLTEQMHPIVDVTGFFLPDKRTAVTNVNAVYDEAIRQARMLPGERRAQPTIDSMVLARMGKLDFMVQILVSALDNAVAAGEHIFTEVNGTRLMLAISIYHAEHGRYPDSLNDLVPDLLAELPTDRWAPDGQYRYLRRPPTETDSREYLLYSVGYDETDDMGSAADRHLAFGKHDPGTDYVFHQFPFDKFTDQ